MQTKEIADLINKYFLGTATEQERQTLLEWYETNPDEVIEWELERDEDEDTVKSRIFENIDYTSGKKTKRYSSNRFRTTLVAAAALLVFVSIGLFFYIRTEGPSSSSVPETPSPDIQPGGNKAVLTLADGSKINLDETSEGLLANQAGTSVNKISDGQLLYKTKGISEDQPNSATLYNTVETPIGGKYQLSLPDGSLVWLNSSSSLRFPTAFNGTAREVELQGEAYFEVAKSTGKIFKVTSGKHIVEVLGTHFNINAYTDEPEIRTTLLEGKVRVSKAGFPASRVLGVGEQSRWGKQLRVVSVDPQFAVSWKEGYFRFHDADIKSVMRQLGRWYGVTMRSEGKIPTQTYGGAIDMDLSLLQVLEILENGKVNFRLEGKEVVFMPELQTGQTH